MGLGQVFLSHYRRHPGQLAGLLLILVCAATLWSGVRSLTGAAADAVDRSRTALEPVLSVERSDGQPLAVSDFARLRRAGLCVTPRLTVRLPGRDAPTVVGIDPFTAPCLRQYRSDEPLADTLVSGLDQPLLLGSAADLVRWQQLGLTRAGQYQLRETAGLPRGQLLADIAVAANLAHVNTEASRVGLDILLPAGNSGGRAEDKLEGKDEQTPLPAGYRGQVADYGVEPDPLVEAFLLSLDALGALALLVAALLVRSVYRFALEQRRRTLDTLVRLGVPPLQLRLALLAEVVLVALIGGSLGVWLGAQLASAMAGGFQWTLSGLFSVDSLAGIVPTATTWLGLVLVLVLLVGWACFDLLMLRPAGEGGGDNASERGGCGSSRRAMVFAACLVLALSLATLLVTDQLWLVFLSAGGCLVGAGLLLPELLNRLLGWVQHRTGRPLLEWSCSEMRALCRLLQLPLMALAFAIATAIGVQAMVTGFESTFARWLDQRLQGDLYLDPGRPMPASEEHQWRGQLQALPGVSSVLPMVRGRGVYGPVQVDAPGAKPAEIPVDVFAVDPASPLLVGWRFLKEVEDPWDAMRQGGVMVNEQLARRQGLAPGQQIQFRLGRETLSRRIAAVYADYGRPQGEILLPLSALPENLPRRYASFVLGLATGNVSEEWRGWTDRHSWLSGARLRDQRELKAAANAAFARTFDMTRLLNYLTLAIAGTALALMGLVIFRLRQGRYRLLHVYGVQRPALRRRLLAHSMLVTGLLAVLATPVGIFLGWVLVDRVNPAAFGWALPLELYPGFWLQVWLASLGIGALVGVLAGDPVRLETLKNE